MGTIPVAEIAAARRLGVVFTRAEALAAGVTLAQLRGPRVARVYRGVFTLALDPGALGVRARAACRLAGPGHLVCDTTGLALLGVDLPTTELASTVHLWVPPGSAGVRMPGIRLHRDRLTRPPKRITAGLTTVNPAECWLQTAAALDVRDLVILADGLMRRQDPILFLEDLQDALAGGTGRRGVRAARRALELARAGTESPMETRVRLILVEAGLPCPIVDHPLIRPGGAEPYRLDMAYPEARVAVEYDGGDHVNDVGQMRRDQTRRRWIEDQGWRLITATASDIPHPAGLVASVRQALSRG